MARVVVRSYCLTVAAGLALVVSAAGCRDGHVSPDEGSGSSVSAEPTDSSPTAAALLSRAQRLMQQENVQAADSLVREVLVREPEHPSALMLAAQIAHRRGEVDQCVRLLESAASQWPERQAAPLIRAADVLWRAGRHDEARQRYQRILQHESDHLAAHRGLAALLNRRGLRFDANEHIRFLCRHGQARVDELRCLIFPTGSYARFAQKPDVDSEEAIERHGPLNVVRALFLEGELRDALTVLQRSQSFQDRHPAAMALHGQLLLESQQPQLFQRWLSDLEESWQRYPSCWMALGGWAMHQGRNEQAVRMFAEAIVREPGDVAAYDWMTQALEGLGKQEVAKRFHERSVKTSLLVRFARKVLSNPDVTAGALKGLAEDLAAVGRPFEALAWQDIAASRGTQRLATAQAVARARQQMLGAETTSRIRQTLLCGLNRNDYPLDIVSLAKRDSSKAAPPQIPAADPIQVPAKTPMFANVAAKSGLDFRYYNADPPVARHFMLHQTLGAGVACLDYDRDGYIDLYVGQGSGNPPQEPGTRPNLLARNLGDRFQTVTDPAGADDRRYTTGLTAGDWNQDGFSDLVVGNLQGNRLLINQGDGTFRPQSGDALWQDSQLTTGLAIGDVNGDHLPDLTEISYIDDPGVFEPIEHNPDGTPVKLPGPLHFRAAADRVFLGQADGTMQGQALQTTGRSRPGLGLLITDVDSRFGNEIFVANDLAANNYWIRADRPDGSVSGTEATAAGNGENSGSPEHRWRDAAVARGVAYGPHGKALACMGIAAADFNQDAALDLHITNFTDEWSNHYMQTPEGSFVDQTLPYGLDQPTLKMLGFGAAAIDYDNNSSMDLVVGNGHIDDLREKGYAFEMPTQLFVGDGTAFEPASVLGDSEYWNGTHLSRSLVTLDWNNDGRMDFAVTDLKQPLALLENRTETPHHWLQVELVGTRTERDAIGARVRLEFGHRTLTGWVTTGDGYLGKSQSLLGFGLGTQSLIDRVTVLWPDGSEQSFQQVAADRRLLIVQDDPQVLDVSAQLQTAGTER